MYGGVFLLPSWRRSGPNRVAGLVTWQAVERKTSPKCPIETVCKVIILVVMVFGPRLSPESDIEPEMATMNVLPRFNFFNNSSDNSNESLLKLIVAQQHKQFSDHLASTLVLVQD